MELPSHGAGQQPLMEGTPVAPQITTMPAASPPAPHGHSTRFQDHHHQLLAHQAPSDSQAGSTGDVNSETLNQTQTSAAHAAIPSIYTTFPASLIRPPNRTSDIWDHFKVLADMSRPGKAVCNHCGKEVQHGNSTSNLAAHMRVRHPELVAGTKFEKPTPMNGVEKKPRVKRVRAAKESKVVGAKAEERGENEQQGGANVQQGGAKGSNVPPAGVVSPVPEMPSPFEDAFIQWVVSTKQSPDICNNKHFRKMVAVLNPAAVLPSKERLEQQILLRDAPVDVKMVLETDKVAPVSWVASLITTLRKKIVAPELQSGAGAETGDNMQEKPSTQQAEIDNVKLQLEELRQRWSGGMACALGEIPPNCLVASALDPRFKKLKALDKADRERAWQLVEAAALEQKESTEKAAETTRQKKLNRANGSSSSLTSGIHLKGEGLQAYTGAGAHPMLQFVEGDGSVTEDEMSECEEGGEGLGSGGDSGAGKRAGEDLVPPGSAKKRKLTVDQVKNELKRYKLVDPIPFTADPLAWWKEQSRNFPLLMELAREVLSYKGIIPQPAQLLPPAGIPDGEPQLGLGLGLPPSAGIPDGSKQLWACENNT